VNERGNVSIFIAAFIVVSLLLCTAVARLGSASAEKSRANNAADASALAAADSLALGRSPSDACADARRIAAANGAELLTCRSDGSGTDVTVAIDDAQARARAEVASVGP
jgi:secretion/DNA translocation related TadE-like protein